MKSEVVKRQFFFSGLPFLGMVNHFDSPENTGCRNKIPLKEVNETWVIILPFKDISLAYKNKTACKKRSQEDSTFGEMGIKASFM